MTENYNRTRRACYYSYLSMSSVFCVPALLFVTFHEQYGISYTLLGTLVMINFCTQLSIDLIFTFFSRFFNVRRVVRFMPLLTSFGLFTYAWLPTLMPQNAFLGLAIGTVFFSVSSGLSEVLLSPIVAALPSEHPERDMSLLHSLYAWGVMTMVLISTLFLRLFGTQNWMYLISFLAILPLGASFLFRISPIPDLSLSQSDTGTAAKRQATGIFLCTVCIFLGSSAENVMTNWISGFMENALHISKDWCDIIGIAVFAFLLGSVRTLYARYGKNIITVLLVGMIGATACYLIAGLCNSVWLVTVACILTGAFTSMLWPGTLIMMEENMPALGVAAYALMAAGGDFGASVAPQLMGIVTDAVSALDTVKEYALANGLTAEEIGLKAGMVIAAVFPAAGTVIVLIIRRYFGKKKKAPAAAESAATGSTGN